MAGDLLEDRGLDLGLLEIGDARQPFRLVLQLPDYVVSNLRDLLFFGVEDRRCLVQTRDLRACRRLIRLKAQFRRELRLRYDRHRLLLKLIGIEHNLLKTNGRIGIIRFVDDLLESIMRDDVESVQLMRLIQSEGFFEGRYAAKVIQVDSSKTGAEEDEMVERLLKVEHTEEPTEIVIHVNMLKEGWDVTNLYTIVPLRAANARTLIEQSIGRGLRLPYGRRTGVIAVARMRRVARRGRWEYLGLRSNRAGPSDGKRTGLGTPRCPSIRGA